MSDTRPTHAADEPAETAAQHTDATPAAGSSGGIDYDTLAAKMAEANRETLKAGLRDALEGYAQDHQIQPRQPVYQPAPQPATPSDPVRDFLSPYMEPRLQRVEQALVVRTEAAMDAATFYSDPDPRAAQLKARYRGEIEQLFNQELAAGRYTPREALFNYIKGVKLNELLEAEIAERKAAEERARQAQTAGGGAPRSVGTGPQKQPWEMTPEELERALEGVAF